MKRYTPIVASLAVPLAATAALATLGAAPPQDPDPGAAIFRGKGNCFACHGPTATGTPLAPDLTDDVWISFDQRPTPAEVSALVRAGVPTPVEHPAPMPPMGGGRLSDEEIDQVAAWVLSLSAGASDPAVNPAVDPPMDPPADPSVAPPVSRSGASPPR